jgi:TRAP-type C4-dicarboxylate transport system substrate-binding protein
MRDAPAPRRNFWERSMNFHVKTWAAGAFGVALAVGAGLGPAAAQTKWDMPTPYADGNLHTKNVRAFAAEVEKATGGKLVITVHSNASLLKLPEIKRGVQTGQVQIGETLISSLGNEDPMFAFDAVPGLATSYDAARKLYAAARPFVEARFARQGLTMLYSVAWPPQGIYAKKELNSLGDLRGSKFRAYNPATARFAELMGASPITVQASEIAQAFRTGVAESMITSGATGVDTQAWDYLTHYYDLSAFLPQNVVLVNKAAFDALPADVRAAVLAAAKAAEDRGWKSSIDENEGYKKTMAEKGIKVLAPPPAMIADVKRIGDTMAKEWAARAGADGAAVLAEYAK